MSPFAKPVLAVLVAVGVAIGFKLESGASPPAAPARHAAIPGPRLDATSDAEARRMWHVTMTLARRLAAATRCDPSDAPTRYATCVVPALRQAGIGGRMAATALHVVIAGVPMGGCRGYLLGLQAANEGAGESARGLPPHLYWPDRRRTQHEVATQIALTARMLRHAAAAAPANACAPTPDGPAA
jgi:hypothetical protein